MPSRTTPNALSSRKRHVVPEPDEVVLRLTQEQARELALAATLGHSVMRQAQRSVELEQARRVLGSAISRPMDVPVELEPFDGVDYWVAHSGAAVHLWKLNRGADPDPAVIAWCGARLVEKVRPFVGQPRCRRCARNKALAEEKANP